jgi:multimeric flavodoxin WrbA
MLVEDRRPIRVVIIDGSVRYAKSCPGQGGKTTKFAKFAMAARPDGVEVDYVDLRIKGDGVIVQPCKGCVSTAGGYHCHWPCSCYGPDAGDGGEGLPDLMYDQEVYSKLERADGFLVFTPNHWYSPSANVKSLFDRLVCASLSLSVEDASRLTGGDPKNPAKTRALSKSGEHDDLLRNWLAGRVAGFFVHGLDGADDYTGDQLRPPKTIDPRDKKTYDPKQACDGIVRTCRYMGIKVPDELIVSVILGNHRTDYASSNDLPLLNPKLKAAALMRGLVREIKKSRTGR